MQIVSAGFRYVSVQRPQPSRAAFVYVLCHIWHDKAKFPSNATDECSLHFPNWEVASDGSFLAHRIRKCIAAQFFCMERQWVGQAATTSQVEADVQYVMAAAGNDAANY